MHVGDPLEILTCVEEDDKGMPPEEHQQGGSIGDEPLDCEGLEASLDALCANLPEDEPEFERGSIYLRD